MQGTPSTGAFDSKGWPGYLSVKDGLDGLQLDESVIGKGAVNADGEGMIEFGQELRQERESRGVSVGTVCAITKVSLRHVEALEDGRLSDLPGGVFRKGIVRSYIAAVGLEETIWIERFEASMREQGGGPREQDWVEFAENVKKSRSGNGSATGTRWFGVALMLLALAICVFLTWKLVLHSKLPI